MWHQRLGKMDTNKMDTSNKIDIGNSNRPTPKNIAT
jgi:hypothetical protein